MTPDLRDSASSKEDFEGKMASLAYGNGLMTAIIVGPEPVPQTEWLPMLLNSADVALDDEDTRLLTGMILAQYSSIIKMPQVTLQAL
jgi:yecA family protein